MAKAKTEKIVFLGTGRRKKSIARVRLMPGTGVITVNGRELNEYFGPETLKSNRKTTISCYKYFR